MATYNAFLPSYILYSLNCIHMSDLSREPAPSSAAGFPAAPGNARPASLRELFWCFSLLGSIGFGGVTPWARRILVDRKHWIDDREFADLLSVGQLLPGSNVSNLAIILGRSYFGWRGAVAAVCGLYLLPLCFILILGVAYQYYGDLPAVQKMLGGVMPVAAGLVIATGIKLARSFPVSAHTVGFGLLTFVAMALLKLTLPVILLAVAPLAIGAAWRSK